MEKLIFLSLVLPLFLLHFCPVPIRSEPYNFPDKYFINCGSDSSLNQGSRRFVGDTNPNSSSVTNGKPVTNTSQSADLPLYQTARFDKRPFWYKFDITENGKYVVRLHFLPFMSNQVNLADALFNVSASNKSLVSNLSFRNSSSEAMIKDFLVPINSTSFRINFNPAHPTSFAFVNAIEVFRAPNLDDNQTHVTSAGSEGPYQGLPSQILRTVQRVIVGGESFNDSFSTVVASEWVSDDDYIFIGNSAKKCNYMPSGEVKYVDDIDRDNVNYNVAPKNFVPESVYMGCKKVTLDGGASNATTNITWHFNVSKNARHLVRVHFCDFISPSYNTLNFNILIYNKFSQQITPFYPAVPFYHDFVVDSGDSDFISISIVPWVELTGDKSAFLNGLEIMEFITEPGFEAGGSEPERKPAMFIIIGSVVVVLVICSLIVAFLLCKKRRKRKPFETIAAYGALPLRGASPYVGRNTKSVNLPPVPNLNLKLKMPFAEIVEATNNFEAKLLIGEGGFGKVYKGTLRNGLKVAVKRSESKHGQGLPEFQTEVMVLSKIRHRHLVSLIGYCDEGSEMILVYEFMEKGTLREHLYDMRGNPESSSALSLLTWRQRLEICIGAAKGLYYLHTGLDGGIIHRDVKSTNILLDEEYVAKVADFGLSKSGLLDPDEFSTGIKGSFGYLDPEYFRCLQFTEKSDVYSFGVVLLEVLCARAAIINSHSKDKINLAEWGLFWLKKGELEKIIDPSMAGQINSNSLRKFGEIVEKCLKPNGADRPTMLDICWDLEYTLQLQQTAVHREPHEDSAIDASLDSSSCPFQRLPSNNFPIEKDDVLMEKDDGSDTTASGVFSQLRVDGGR
ncbi:hypothetical protein DITRI_Ditri16bG0039500 [Diplodiscus trichospermus]